jgi:hypothetical protein
MSFGISAATAAEIAVAASAAVSAAGAISSGISQSRAASYQAQVASNNAKIAGYNANAAIETGNQKLQAAQEKAAEQMGAIRAAMGASGVDLNSGSALRNQQGLAEVNDLNEQTITSNAARSAWNFRNQGNDFTAQAGLDEEKAQSAETAGLVGGFSSLLSGAGTFAKNYNQSFPSATQ